MNLIVSCKTLLLFLSRNEVKGFDMLGEIFVVVNEDLHLQIIAKDGFPTFRAGPEVYSVVILRFDYVMHA